MADAAATTATETAPSAAANSKKHSVTNLQEVQDTVSRLAAHKGVLAVLILNHNGDIVTQSVIESSSNSSSSSNNNLGNPKLLSKMLQAARIYVDSMSSSDDSNNNGDGSNNNNSNTEKSNEEAVDELMAAASKGDTREENINFVRIRTPQNEVLVAPKSGYTLVVLQDPSISAL